MEQAFGQDLGHVRVHADDEAARGARELGALAFTFGRDIFLGPDVGRNGNGAAARVLAHEVTHVVQARSSPPAPGRGLRVSSPTDPAEREANRVATALLGGAAEPVKPSVSATSAAVIHRQAPSPAAAPPVPVPTPAPAPAAAPPGTQPAPAGSQPVAAQIPPEVAAQMAYSATVMKRVQPLGKLDSEKLAGIIGQSPVYGLIRERDMKREESQRLQARLTELVGTPPGQSLPGGAPIPAPGPPGAAPPPAPGGLAQFHSEGVKELGDRIAALTSEVEKLDAQIKTMLQALGTTEEKLVAHVEKEFPELWIKRGKDIAYAMLDENRAVVETEMKRYGVSAAAADVDGLKAADQELSDLYEDTKKLDEGITARSAERQKAQEELQALEEKSRAAQSEGSLPGGVPPTKEEIERVRSRVQTLDVTLQQLNDAKAKNQSALVEKRNSYGLRYPVMLQPEYHYGSLYRLTREELEKTSGGWLQNILDNIEKTRTNIREDKVHVWDLKRVPEMTYQSLGVDPKSALGQAVEEYTSKITVNEELIESAITALAIGVAIVAALATMGGSLLLAAAATGFGAGLTLGQLAHHAGQFTAESAAQRVALNPELAAISKNEPDLLPVVMDFLSLAMELGAAIKAARAVAAAERAFAASGDVAALRAGMAKGGVPANSIERYVGTVSQRYYLARTIRQALLKMGVLEPVDLKLVVKAIEQSAEEGVARWIAKADKAGKLHLRTEAGCIEAFGDVEGRKVWGEFSKKRWVTGTHLKGHVFIAPELSIDSASATLVHEITHHVQAFHFPHMERFVKEFTAYKVQQRYLLGFPEKDIPEEWKWLFKGDDAVIEKHINDLYGAYRTPATEDIDKALQKILDSFEQAPF